MTAADFLKQNKQTLDLLHSHYADDIIVAMREFAQYHCEQQVKAIQKQMKNFIELSDGKGTMPPHNINTAYPLSQIK